MGIEPDFKGTAHHAFENGGATAGTCRESRQGREDCFPPVSFMTFVLSLAHSAMVFLGEAPEPESGQYRQNLTEAKHAIDTLAMLECKTQGNLASEECEILSSLLCELRLIYVKKL